MHKWKNSARSRERGATVVEYAFLTGLLMVALTAVVGQIEESEAEALNDAGGRVGIPEEYSSYSGRGGSVLPPGGGGGAAGGSIEASVALSATVSQQGSQKWTTVVDVAITDVSGNPILDGEITGTWIKTYIDGSTQVESGQCTSNSSGTCTLSLWNLHRVPHSSAVVSVQFTVDALTAADVTPAAGAIGSFISVVAP
ncbi:MAG: Flp pilus assembly pilin Flp [Acidimicrobiales bacterium]|jgi:Flp pilus assembly pilin Flp